MLRTLRAPPEFGSLRESVLTLLQMKLETIEHARFRALSQIVIDKEKGVEAFEEYMKLAFPYLEAAKKQDRKAILERLQKEVYKGPIVVTPMEMPKMKSRVSTARAARTSPQSPSEEKRLYKKIGRHI